MMDDLIQRVAARYKNKKKVKNKDGEETTVYEYSDKQIEHRNREKRKAKMRGSEEPTNPASLHPCNLASCLTRPHRILTHP